MKSTLFILFILIASFGFSQDKIVKKNGEEIFCQITRIGSDSISYITPYKDVTKINYSIARSQVKLYYLNVNEGTKNNENNDYVKEFDEPNMENNKPILVDYPKFTIGANGGFSYLLAQIGDITDPEIKDYYKDLKNGYHFGGDATYFLNKNIGLGARFSIFKTENSLEIIAIYPNGTYRTGILKDDIRNTFIGPSFTFRVFPGKRNSPIVLSNSIGYFGYYNNGYLIDPIKLTGQTVGMALNVGYDLQLEKHLYLSFQLSLIAGSLSKAEVETGGTTKTIEFPVDQQENMSRVDLSIGIRFGE